MKKVLAITLAMVMAFTALFTMTASAEVNVTAKGFTVAPETANIDWTAVAADENGDFAMLCAYNGGADSAFEQNYAGAKAAGVEVGAYLVMNATTVEEAQGEAVGMLKVIAGKQFEYPVCVQLPETASANVAELVLAIMEKLSEGGRLYLTVFVTADFANNNETVMTALGAYDTWFTEAANASVTATDIADPSYTGYYHICEYAFGEVSGVEGTVALDYVKDYDFASIMNNANLNGYGTSTIVAPADPVEPEDPENPEQPQDPVTDTDIPNDPVTNTDTPTDTDVPTPTDITLGDVNGDDAVNAKDALEVLKFAVGKTDLTADQQKAAEVDGKEGINAKDALQILKYAVKKITKFPIEG